MKLGIKCLLSVSDNEVCQRCSKHSEDASHIFTCPDEIASNHRKNTLYSMLPSLVQIHTPIHVLQILEDNLSFYFCIPSSSLYKAAFLDTQMVDRIRTTVTSQNIIRWDNLLWGYISSKWVSLNQHTNATQTQMRGQPWIVSFTKYLIELHNDIWHECNQTIIGKTHEEVKSKARATVLKCATQIYSQAPKLAPRFPLIQQTQQLQDWLHRVKHQELVAFSIILPASQKKRFEFFLQSSSAAVVQLFKLHEKK